ncbi:hypothetical protein [Streptomyces sp. NPDC086989]|uniref:hypothetical protein n=1 Tax=Streptomyces sp. NPDC086989 TaxID=3365764 RepID=UPI0037F97C69
MSQQPAPEVTVTWSVMFKDSTGAWSEWGRGGWPTSDLAIRSAEAIVSIPTVQEIRFDRITTSRQRFSLHDLAQAEE